MDLHGIYDDRHLVGKFKGFVFLGGGGSCPGYGSVCTFAINKGIANGVYKFKTIPNRAYCAILETAARNSRSRPLRSLRTPIHRPFSRRLDRCDRMIQNECRNLNGGNVYYFTMQITFLTTELNITGVAIWLPF